MDLNESWPPSETLSGHLVLAQVNSWTESWGAGGSRALQGLHHCPHPTQGSLGRHVNPGCSQG